MAEAKRITISQEKTVTEEVPHVSLTLTLEEAGTLVTILEKVGGHPERSRRKHADAIRGALMGNVGLLSTGYDASGAIMFGTPVPTVESADEPEPARPFAGIEYVNGEAYDITALYVDDYGDHWRFHREGGKTVGVCDHPDWVPPAPYTLSRVIDEFGPLTKV